MTGKVIENEFPKLPARSLEDLRIPEDAIKLDNEIAKRSDGAAMDLAKWALLGVAGYGFLLKEVAMSSPSALLACQKFGAALIVGAFLLAASAGLALVSKERLIRCSVIQMYILRILKKLNNGGWSEQQTSILEKELANRREIQKKNIVLAERCLRYAHWLLGIGAFVTVLCFALVLFSMRVAAVSAPDKPTSPGAQSLKP